MQSSSPFPRKVALLCGGPSAEYVVSLTSARCVAHAMDRHRYRIRPFAEHDVRLSASLSPFWGVDGLNKYFYEVKPRDERPGRPAYQADNGYIGTELSLGASWGPWERVRLFGGVQFGYWKGSANEDSPLYREDLTVAVGGGVRVMLFRSESLVAGTRAEE